MESQKALKVVAVVAGSAICLAPTAAHAAFTVVTTKNVNLTPTYSANFGGGAVQYYLQPLTSSTQTGAMNFKSNYATNPISVYSDYVLNTSTVTRYVSAQTCRQSWSGVSATCGNPSTATHAAAASGAFELAPTASGVQSVDNSVYDYYYTIISIYSPGGAANFNPNGVAIGGW